MKESIHLISLGCAKNRVDSENIPQLRGKYRSKPMEALVKEARELAEQGPEK